VFGADAVLPVPKVWLVPLIMVANPTPLVPPAPPPDPPPPTAQYGPFRPPEPPPLPLKP
jgi:hypothetical protein